VTFNRKAVNISISAADFLHHSWRPSLFFQKLQQL
jgi:hypothetical protein